MTGTQGQLWAPQLLTVICAGSANPNALPQKYAGGVLVVPILQTMLPLLFPSAVTAKGAMLDPGLVFGCKRSALIDFDRTLRHTGPGNRRW